MGNSNQPPPPAPGLLCGDCRNQILEVAPAPDGDDYYCPRCAQPTPAPIACNACGSAICPDCGTPVERADELGIG